MPQSVKNDHGTTTVIVPIKPLFDAKSRNVSRIPQRIRMIRKGFNHNYSNSSRSKSASRSEAGSNNSQRTHKARHKISTVKINRRLSGPQSRKAHQDCTRAHPIPKGPVMRKQVTNGISHKLSGLPDQDTGIKPEEAEIKDDYSKENSLISSTNKSSHETDADAGDMVLTETDEISLLQINWQEKLTKYEQMKTDLNTSQRDIMQMYASLRDAHNRLCAVGLEPAPMPPAQDLRVMNVASLTPAQVMEICGKDLINVNSLIDMDKLHKVHDDILAACDMALLKRNEIIDWMSTIIKNDEKGIGLNSFKRKINEFTRGSKKLEADMEAIKIGFDNGVKEVMDFITKSIHDTMALQLRNEELNSALTELHSQTSDLRKQLQTNHRVYSAKQKTEDLEKELKEEKCRKNIIKERLMKAEVLLKAATEKVVQLEFELDDAKSVAWNMEEKVHDLQEQNMNLQREFNKELNKLRQSIQDNTVHLKEIASAREQLQIEKYELENQREQQMAYYKTTFDDMQNNKKSIENNLKEAEEKLQVCNDDKNQIALEMESVREDLVLTRRQLEDYVKKLEEKDAELRKAQVLHQEMNETLKEKTLEIRELKNKMIQVNEIIISNEHDLKVLKEKTELVDELKCDLLKKETLLTELQNAKHELEDQLQERNYTIQKYQDQESIIRRHMDLFKEDIGDFIDLNNLRQIMRGQISKITDMTTKNKILTDDLQKKETECLKIVERNNNLDLLLKQKNEVLKQLSDKEQEQNEIIELLQADIAMRVEMDTKANKTLSEKDIEIESLTNNVEKRKEQIKELETIVHTLEEQNRTMNVQRQLDRETINSLEDRIAGYESLCAELQENVDLPKDNIENLMKILEKELLPYDHEQTGDSNSFVYPSRKYKPDILLSNNRSPEYKMEGRKKLSPTRGFTQRVPTKIVTANSKCQGESDSSCSKSTRGKVISKFPTDRNIYSTLHRLESDSSRPSNRIRNEKNMLKLACHRMR
ncbi:hypothetical protein JYU34_009271 [Plutella xylostella]|uniref:Uncharacterized protein n=1 Tax=Plutella xylostella TaxID=51655 RepID=A0ABQ7QJ72_PLUXY|nr:hypothetical protein JYU34_009271 [Plutella xylostella]